MPVINALATPYRQQLQAQLDRHFYELGEAAGYLIKAGGTPEPTYSLTGRLYVSATGWGLLSVPNAVVRGLFDAMHEPGLELPLRDGKLEAHVSVLTKAEIDRIGGPEKLTERGHQFRYQLGPMKVVSPTNWGDVSRAFFVTVVSPDLKKLRVSYGLTPLPYGDHEFHVTCGIIRRHVNKPGPVGKGAGPLQKAGLDVETEHRAPHDQEQPPDQGVSDDQRRKQAAPGVGSLGVDGSVDAQGSDRAAGHDARGGAGQAGRPPEAAAARKEADCEGRPGDVAASAPGADPGTDPVVDLLERLLHHADAHGLCTLKHDRLAELLGYSDEDREPGGVPGETALRKIGEHTHTEPDGSTYDIERLIELLADRPTESFPLDSLALSRSSRTGFSKKRYEAADPSYPGIVGPDGSLFDGRHRAIKLRDSGAAHGEFRRATPLDLMHAKLADLLPGGLADDRPDSDFDPQALARGQAHEGEHTDDPLIAKEIAEDHLAEDGDYYEKLEQVEKQALSGKALLGAAQNFVRKVNVGGWQPSAASQRLGITNPAARLARFANKADRWIGTPQTGALGRAVKSFTAAGSKLPLPEMLPMDAPLAQQGWHRWGLQQNVAEHVAERGFGIKPRDVGISLYSPKPDGSLTNSAWLPDKNYLHGIVRSLNEWPSLLHELGHAKTVPGNAALDNVTNRLTGNHRNVWAAELLANTEAGRASRALRAGGMSAPDSKTLGDALRPALETYRLGTLRSWLRSRADAPFAGGHSMVDVGTDTFPRAIRQAFPVPDRSDTNWYPRASLMDRLRRLFS